MDEATPNPTSQLRNPIDRFAIGELLGCRGPVPPRRASLRSRGQGRERLPFASSALVLPPENLKAPAIALIQINADGTGQGSRMVGPFIFRCPSTGLNVQHLFSHATPGNEDDRLYVGVRCLACSGMHLINRRTGRPINDRHDK